MRAHDTAIRECGLPELYLVNDFEDTLTELGGRVLLCDVEENDCSNPYALAEIAAVGAWATFLVSPVGPSSPLRPPSAVSPGELSS